MVFRIFHVKGHNVIAIKENFFFAIFLSLSAISRLRTVKQAKTARKNLTKATRCLLLQEVKLSAIAARNVPSMTQENTYFK